MAFVTETKRVDDSDDLVYTVPPGKQAEITFFRITNSSSPAVDIEITVRWVRPNPVRNGDFMTDVLIRTTKALDVLSPGFVMNAGDTINVLVVTTGGQADVVLSMDVTP